MNSFQNSFPQFIRSFLSDVTVCTDNRMFSTKSMHLLTMLMVLQCSKENINLRLNLLYSLSPLKRMEGILTTSWTICLTFLPFDSCFWQFLCIFWLVIDSILLPNSDSRVLYCKSNKLLEKFTNNLTYNFNSCNMLVSTKEVAILERDLQNFRKNRGRWSLK